MNAPTAAVPGREPDDAPFHAGELAVQQRAGVTEAADAAGRRGIRRFMPEQHRTFFGQLPFFVLGGVDAHGQPWATLRVGMPGFVTTPDARTLRIGGDALPGDPDKQHAILDQANTTTGPETPRGSQPPLSRKEKQAETGAAWAAAIIGSAFSTSENVTLGASTTFDENTIFVDPGPEQAKPPAPPPEKVDAKTLVPWIKLEPSSPEQKP